MPLIRKLCVDHSVRLSADLRGVFCCGLDWKLMWGYWALHHAVLCASQWTCETIRENSKMFSKVQEMLFPVGMILACRVSVKI